MNMRTLIHFSQPRINQKDQKRNGCRKSLIECKKPKQLNKANPTDLGNEFCILKTEKRTLLQMPMEHIHKRNHTLDQKKKEEKDNTPPKEELDPNL